MQKFIQIKPVMFILVSGKPENGTVNSVLGHVLWYGPHGLFRGKQAVAHLWVWINHHFQGNSLSNRPKAAHFQISFLAEFKSLCWLKLTLQPKLLSYVKKKTHCFGVRLVCNCSNEITSPKLPWKFHPGAWEMQLQLQPFMVFIRTPGKERSACALVQLLGRDRAGPTWPVLWWSHGDVIWMNPWRRMKQWMFKGWNNGSWLILMDM